MKLDLYIARRFLWLFVRVFGGFFAVLLAIGVLEELRRFSGSGISLRESIKLALLNAPSGLYQILPLIMILASIGLFSGLARSSELVVVRASGRSGLRFLVSPVVTAFLIGGLGVAVWNPIVAATARAYDDLSSGQARGGPVLSINEAGLWLRQGSANGQTVIQAQRANLDGTELYDVSFLTYGSDGRLRQRISGAQAALIPGAWVLPSAKTWSFAAQNPERQAMTSTEPLSVPTDLTRDKIADSFGTPRAVSIWDLGRYIADLEAAGFSGLSHRMWYNVELASPAFLVGMVLIAAAFTMRHTRGGRPGPLILIALLCGFLIFFLRNFGQVLGENGQIPVILAAWSPPLIAILLSAGLLLHQEDG
jgi:lipopolysaccharide export system permease protein